MTGFDHTLPMLLHRTLDSVMPAFRDLFAKYNLTDQQWRVLRILWEDEKVTSAELSARSLIPAPSLVGIIDRLERRKLVARMRSLEDRRIVYVVATEKGRSLGGEVMPYVEDINRRISACLSPAEWQAMEQALSKIVSGVADTEQKEKKIA